MKRSSMIFLGATGLLIAGAWLGRSGGPVSDTDKAEIYESLSACVTANAMTRDQCESEFAAAQEKHLKDAPRFTARGDCEAQYGSGQCQPATIAGTSYFLPALAGVMIAQRLFGQRQPQALLPPLRAQQPCAPGFTPATQPGCVMPRSTSSSGGTAGGWRSYSTAGGSTISRDASRSGPITVPRTVTTGRGTAPSATTTSTSSQSSTVSRGGFGSTARSTSSSSST